MEDCLYSALPRELAVYHKGCNDAAWRINYIIITAFRINISWREREREREITTNDERQNERMPYKNRKLGRPT